MRVLLVSLAVLATSVSAAPKVIAVNVGGVVHPITVEIIGHAIDQAERENAAAVLLRLNTPGGLLDATREITSRIVASRVPVIAYVAPSGGAASSAAFLLSDSAGLCASCPGPSSRGAGTRCRGARREPARA